MKVIVIGAGVAGLAAAAGLARAGAEVAVVERAPERPQGSGLSLVPNGLAALDRVGLGAAVERLTGGVGPQGGGIRTPSGRWLARVPASATEGLRVVHRAELREAMLEPVRGLVRIGEARLLDIERAEVEVDGETLRADLVLGADGLRSRVRAAAGLDAGTRRAGYGAWRGVTPEPFADVLPSETWGRGERFGLTPLPDGRVYWFAVLPDDGDARDVAEVEERFGRWHDPIPDILAATPREAMAWTPIEELRRMPSRFARGRVALLGDAAHAMTPNLGQGGNQGLEDAATLVALLEPVAAGSPSATELAAALSRYDGLRRRRTASIARSSRVMGAVGQLSGPGAAVRDALLAALPDSLAAGGSGSLTSWRPPER